MAWPVRARWRILVVWCGEERLVEIGNYVTSTTSASGTAAIDIKELGLPEGEVHVVYQPTLLEIKDRLVDLQPNAVYCFGGVLKQDKEPASQIAALKFGPPSAGNADAFAAVFSGHLPELVYLDASSSSGHAEALRLQGVKNILHWPGPAARGPASCTSRAFFSIIQSGPGVCLYEAFKVAEAALHVHCRCSNSSSAAVGGSSSVGPSFIGSPPLKPKFPDGFDDQRANISVLECVQPLRLLLCGNARLHEPDRLQALVAALVTMVNMELRQLRVVQHGNAGTPNPQAASRTQPDGLSTTRCDLCTSSGVRFSLVAQGLREIFTKRPLLEASLRRELLALGPLINLEESSTSWSSKSLVGVASSMPSLAARRSLALAGGAATFEVVLTCSSWAKETLVQLAMEPSYRGLAALGIAGVAGRAVAAFTAADASFIASLQLDRTEGEVSQKLQVNGSGQGLAAKREASITALLKARRDALAVLEQEGEGARKRRRLQEGTASNKTLRRAAAQVIPMHLRPPPLHLLRPLSMPKAEGIGLGQPREASPSQHGGLLNGGSGEKKRRKHRRSEEGLLATPSVGAVVGKPPEVIRRHGCSRPALGQCTEEELLKDVATFLQLRGHSKLVPQGGHLSAFPSIIINGRRLDLYNLYTEVVGRGGFYNLVNIHWKKQVWPRMRNYKGNNGRRLGVGPVLRKHYETYLLEYEMAHDDVEGEFCVLCRLNSERSGEWINCNACDGWVHFECDKRDDIGAFHDYDESTGREYFCPRCSAHARELGTPL